MKMCQYCQKTISGRPDKKFCDAHCRSAFQYQTRKEEDRFYFRIRRQLNINRKILKKYNLAGLARVDSFKLQKEGFNPRVFTHYYKTKSENVYLFCYEYGFHEVFDNGKKKYTLIKWQPYMEESIT